MLKIKISNLNKKIILLLSDLLIIIASLSAAFSIRLEEFYPFWKIDISIYILYSLVLLIVFSIFNIYQILIRYFDNFSIFKIVKAIFIFQVILIVINLLIYKYIYFPRSVSFIAPIFIGILIIIHRIILNYLINSGKNNISYQNNIIIYGINENTVSLLNSLRQTPNYGTVIGFIDNLKNFKKREVNGIKIYKKDELNKLINEKKINEIIIGPKGYPKKKLSELFNSLNEYNIRIRKISDTKNYLKNFIKKGLENKIDFYDIVNRPKILVDSKILKKKIFNKKILVTGGGGSIGGELCVEILKHSPKKLYILENSEINLFNILKKIGQLFKQNKKKVKPILGDCCDEKFLNFFFKNKNLDEIYHTAAYKHVNFGENNPYAMVKNNIIGTKSIIDLALKKKVKNFTFISSDKAVNPKSLLGHTKRFGEFLVRNIEKINKNINVNFTIVRFGNVIGSSGSVIPIFLDQINKDLPLTVTHKKVKRYFMSISEAVQLVINSSYLNKKGTKIFALDMGKQLKIYDIAKRIIKLSGNTFIDKNYPSGDVRIKVIGLKKGEKISEEITLGKNLSSTSNSKIMICDEKMKKININNKFKKIQLAISSKNFNEDEIKKILIIK